MFNFWKKKENNRRRTVSETIAPRLQANRPSIKKLSLDAKQRYLRCHGSSTLQVYCLLTITSTVLFSEDVF